MDRVANGCAFRALSPGRRSRSRCAQGGGPTISYFQNIGPERGPILHRHGLGAIGVLQARDNNTPIGMAPGTGWNDAGRTTYRLLTHGVDVPGRWVVIDREFRPGQYDGPDSYRPRRPDSGEG
jgi:hypothetical protein